MLLMVLCCILPYVHDSAYGCNQICAFQLGGLNAEPTPYADTAVCLCQLWAGPLSRSRLMGTDLLAARCSVWGMPPPPTLLSSRDSLSRQAQLRTCRWPSNLSTPAARG